MTKGIASQLGCKNSFTYKLQVKAMPFKRLKDVSVCG